jgi:hypothetical protein
MRVHGEIISIIVILFLMVMAITAGVWSAAVHYP